MCKSFEKGMLYVRVLDGAVASFFYPDEENVPAGYSSFHCKNIADIHYNVGEPYFFNYIDTAQHGGRSDAGILIEFRKATDTDIKELLNKWDSRVSIAEWVKSVEKYNPALCQTEKDRIARIAKAYRH